MMLISLPVFSAIDYRAKFTKFTTLKKSKQKEDEEFALLLLKILVLYRGKNMNNGDIFHQTGEKTV